MKKPAAKKSAPTSTWMRVDALRELAWAAGESSMRGTAMKLSAELPADAKGALRILSLMRELVMWRAKNAPKATKPKS